MKLFLLFLILSVSLVYFISCGDSLDNPSDFSPPISGTVTFVDTTRSYIDGYYGIALFRHKTNPFDTLPIKVYSCVISATTSYYFKVSDIQNGEYNIAFIWNKNDNLHYYLLGAYGSGINTSFDSLKYIAYPDYAGMANTNFISHLDISKAILFH